MTDFAERVFEAQRARHVVRIPKYRFVLARITVGLLCVSTILVGALVVSLLLQFLWPEAPQGFRGQGFRQMTLGLFPLFLFAFSILLMVTAVVSFRHFRYGYRFRGSAVIFIVLALSLGCGILYQKADIAFKVHRLLMHRVSPYRIAFEGQRRKHWVQPEAGRLAGVVVLVEPGGITLNDFAGRQWTIRGGLVKDSTKQIRVIGAICGVDFCADTILPWDMMPGQGGGGRLRMRK